MNLRISKALQKIKQQNLDALILFYPSNITYLTEYQSRDSLLIIAKRNNFYVTDSRYTEEAKKRLKDCTILGQGLLLKTSADVCKQIGARRVGFEKKYVTFASYTRLKTYLGSGIKLIPASDIVEELRQVKSEREIEKIRASTSITISAFKFAQKIIAAGRKEIEIAAELECFIRHKGAKASAFEIIVGSGPNSAYPHHISSRRKLRSGEPVLIDMGVDYLGYKSDLTRVFFLDKINALVQRVYDIVRQAQNMAIEKIKPGANTAQVDAAARQYIAKKGYGGLFGHSLGHGVGLDVHEDPNISPKASKALKAGMVFTVEPGIYLPDKFGIRIEDMVLVTRKGVEVISGALDK